MRATKPRSGRDPAYEPGTQIKSRDGKTFYEVQSDGSWKKLPADVCIELAKQPWPGDDEGGRVDSVQAEAKEPKTAGIPPAQKGALSVLQFTPNGFETSADGPHNSVCEAAMEISTYHASVGDQAERHRVLSNALAGFLLHIVQNCPPGPERSTAISRAREAKMWASAAIALEGR